MSNTTQKIGCEPELRSLMKNQHKKVYAICRFFAHNYQEHQRLFADIIAAAAQNIRFRRDNRHDKQSLLLQACINMAALHSIRLELEPAKDRTIQFKSPDYQRSMNNFRENLKDISDLEKFRLFLELEQVSPEEMPALTGITNYRKKVKESEAPAKNFIPYLKEKLIWS